MATQDSLAGMSNLLMYSAMAVYTGALGAFALDLAGRGAAVRQVPRRGPRSRDGRWSRGARDRGGTAAGDDAPPAVPARASQRRGHRHRADLARLRSPPRRRRRPRRRCRARALGQHVRVRDDRARSWSPASTSRSCAAATWRYLGTFVVGPVLLTLGLAIAVLYTPDAQLVPALQSYWLVIHVSVAFIASALFTLGFSTSVLQLVQHRREEARADGPRPARRPVHGRAARRRRARAQRLSAARRGVPAVDVHRHRGRDLGGARVGPLLELGPQGGLVLRHLGRLRRLPARPGDPRLGRPRAPPGSPSPATAALLFNFLVVNIFFVGFHSYSGV